jgi:hypothetical protein
MKYLKICKNIIFSFIAFFAFVANVYALYLSLAGGGMAAVVEVSQYKMEQSISRVTCMIRTWLAGRMPPCQARRSVRR